MCNRLVTYVTSNKNLTNSQFGFRKNSSTDKAAYKLIHNILTALNDKKLAEVYFLIWRKLLTV